LHPQTKALQPETNILYQCIKRYNIAYFFVLYIYLEIVAHKSIA